MTKYWWVCALVTACRFDQEPIARCKLAPSEHSFVTSLREGLMDDLRKERYQPLPASFQWGTATSAFQIENNITQSDWSVWAQTPGHIANGDLPSNGPQHELRY